MMLSSCSFLGNFPHDNRLTLKNFMRRYIMAIDINDKNIDFYDATIDDLIIADITINQIIDSAKEYPYKMDWLDKKHFEIKAELEKRLKIFKQEQIKKIKEELDSLQDIQEKKRSLQDKLIELED